MPKYQVKKEKQWEREDRASGTEMRASSSHGGIYVDLRERSEEVLRVGRDSGLGEGGQECWGDKGGCGGEGGNSCGCCEEGT